MFLLQHVQKGLESDAGSRGPDPLLLAVSLVSAKREVFALCKVAPVICKRSSLPVRSGSAGWLQAVRRCSAGYQLLSVCGQSDASCNSSLTFSPWGRSGASSSLTSGVQGAAVPKCRRVLERCGGARRAALGRLREAAPGSGPGKRLSSVLLRTGAAPRGRCSALQLQPGVLGAAGRGVGRS